MKFGDYYYFYCSEACRKRDGYVKEEEQGIPEWGVRRFLSFGSSGAGGICELACASH